MMKDRSSKDLTEAEEIKKWWQEYTEDLDKKSNDRDNHDRVIPHYSHTSWSVKSNGP